MTEIRTDNTDRFKLDADMSVLSVPPYGLLGGKAPYLLDGDSLKYTFEERRAIAEIDGYQTSLQAQRIAYVDAFIAVLTTLPYEESQGRDWFEQKIRDAQDWLVAQSLRQPELKKRTKILTETIRVRNAISA